MNNIKYEEKEQIYKEYRDVEEKIPVTDFQSALERCKQMVCENFKKDRATKKRKYRERDYVRQKEYTYRGKILSGEIDIPSAENQRHFSAVMKSKYGSVANYHLQKLNSKKDSE